MVGILFIHPHRPNWACGWVNDSLTYCYMGPYYHIPTPQSSGARAYAEKQ